MNIIKKWQQHVQRRNARHDKQILYTEKTYCFDYQQIDGRI